MQIFINLHIHNQGIIVYPHFSMGNHSRDHRKVYFYDFVLLSIYEGSSEVQVVI